MQHFDSDYGEQLLERITRIPEDATPRWGAMRRKDLIEHFVWVLRHAMGRSNRVPDCSNWFSRSIIKFMILNGIAPIPKNTHLPALLRNQGVTLQETGDLETLQAIIEEYLHLVQADELTPAPHPYFGPLTVDDWDKLHIRHFEHHLKQFSV
ncbi:MAG TPA: DUF1569 domain-containing protein [Candidatus Hydrogenedentes bacterium]|nr:DUF1569 domain-containing protein [Candidatus Hydrogenedentota bacterium]